MFKIGNIEIKGKVVCAPMAGVTNKVFRRLAKEQGAALTYTEMTSNVGLKYNSQKTLEIADIDKQDGPTSIQIFGGTIEDYVEGAKFFDQNSEADIIDINMGCPVNKVAIKSEAGSALMKTPEKIREIIRAIIKEISKPLTIKIRIGWDENDLTYMEVAKIAEEEGVAAIAVHGRTRKQMYSGSADWNAIKRIKESVKIPVIGNGDVFTPEDAKRMLQETNVDAVMIAREAQDNPWIFKQVNDYLETGKYEPSPSKNEIIEAIKKYFNDLSKLKNEKVALAQIRGVAISWLKKFNDLKKQRNDFVQLKTWEEMLYLLDLMKDK